jgi:hypothetical protein
MRETEEEEIHGDTFQEVLKYYDEWYRARADKIEIVDKSEIEGPKVIEKGVGRGYRMKVKYQKK